MDALRYQAIDETSIRYGGWRIVAVCFLVATFGWGFGFYGQSVYLAELHRTHGWPASLISGATTFFYLLGAVLVAFVAEAVRAFGPRNCLLAGIAALGLAVVAIGEAQAPWQLYAANALLAFAWAGTSLAMIANTLGLWFDARRGMAISLALNGASFGGIAGVPLLMLAIGHLGFARAMTLAAMVMAAILVPVVAVLIGRPPFQAGLAKTSATSDPQRPAQIRARALRDIGFLSIVAQRPAQIRARALRDIGFLSIVVAFALVLFAQVGFIVHLISFLDPVIGREHAAVAVALLTAMAMAGRIAFSVAIDRLNQRLVSALSFLSQALALAIIINSRNEMVLIAACALFGLSVGNLITLPSLIVQREFAPASFGILISLSTAINQVTYAFGPGVVGLLRDVSGSYTLPFYGCIALEIMAAALILFPSRLQSR
jgi:MFS family permease